MGHERCHGHHAPRDCVRELPIWEAGEAQQRTSTAPCLLAPGPYMLGNPVSPRECAETPRVDGVCALPNGNVSKWPRPAHGVVWAAHAPCAVGGG